MEEFAYKIDRHMPCYRPVTGYFGKTVNPRTGCRPIVFNINESFSGVPVRLPCGGCIGCKLERAREWAVRIVHERKMHSESCFLTLTYRDDRLPPDGSLVLRDLQLFMKRLRKTRPQGLRFFACGEYGEVTLRPHYHVLLLNTDFPDKLHYKYSGERPLYISKEMSELWQDGDHYIGEVTFQSAAYVAGYVTKKTDRGVKYYADEVSEKSERTDGRAKEFQCMSRRPGIGHTWLLKYGYEAFKADSAIIDAREVRLPRYYDNKYAEFSESAAARVEAVKVMRKREMLKMPFEERLVDRRRVRERVDELKVARFKREK